MALVLELHAHDPGALAHEIVDAGAQLDPEAGIGVGRADHRLQKRGLGEGGGSVGANEVGIDVQAKNGLRVGVKFNGGRSDLRDASKDVAEPHLLERLETVREQHLAAKLSCEVALSFEQRDRNTPRCKEIGEGGAGRSGADDDDGGRGRGHRSLSFCTATTAVQGFVSSGATTCRPARWIESLVAWPGERVHPTAVRRFLWRSSPPSI